MNKVMIVGNGVCGIEAALALRRRDAGGRITARLRRARPLLLAAGAHVRLRRPDDAARHRALRPRALRAHALRARARARARGSTRRASRSSSTDGAQPRLRPAAAGRGLARRGPRPGQAPTAPACTTSSPCATSRASTREARPGQRAVVVGGGLIGVEVAEILHDRGLHVHLRDPRELVLPAGPRRARGGAGRRAHARTTACDVRLGANVEEIRARRRRPPRAASRVAGAEIPCDLVVVRHRRRAQHRLPRRQRGHPLAGRRHRGRTTRCARALPDVWAAGDCANVTWADGSRRPEQLWYTARDQGRVAAASMLGDEVVYRRGTWYNSAKFFDLEYTTAGWVPVLLELGQHARRSGPRRAHLVPARAGPLREPAHRLQGRPRGRASTCWAAAGTTSRSWSGSTSGARSTGCWSTCTRRSSTRSSAPRSACCRGRAAGLRREPCKPAS